MKEHVYIIDLFTDIVEATSDYLIDNGLLTSEVYYQYGHPLEIVDTLNKMTQSREVSAKKYPLVALFTDFEERKGERLDVYSEVNLNLIIATLTDPKYIAEQRYTINFKPTLYPIYEVLLYQIRKSTYFIAAHEGRIKHTKIDRLFWGRGGLYGNEKNIFNDFIDAIEIKNLNLLISNKNCYGNFTEQS